jgi:hypothetical protein
MSHAPRGRSWCSQYRHDSLHDHFALETYSNHSSSTKKRTTRGRPQQLLIFSSQDRLYNHFSLSTYSKDTVKTTKDVPAIPAELRSDFPSPSASTREVRDWIQEWFSKRNIVVSDMVINKVTWNGKKLHTMDASAQGSIVLELGRWGIGVKDARMIYQDIGH